jgi:hypothetical protein
MMKIESVDYDGVTFTTQQLPAMRSYRLLARLLKVAGPALTTLASLSPETSVMDAAPMIGGALGGLDPDDAAGLALEILSGTTATWAGDDGKMKKRQLGSQTVIDEVFSGRLRIMLQVLGHALKVNYSDFRLGGSPPAPDAPATAVSGASAL